MSGGTQNEGASVTILETLVEDDEERNDDIGNDVDMTVKVDDVLKSDAPITISPKSARLTRSKRYLIKYISISRRGLSFTFAPSRYYISNLNSYFTGKFQKSLSIKRTSLCHQNLIKQTHLFKIHHYELHGRAQNQVQPLHLQRK